MFLIDTHHTSFGQLIFSTGICIVTTSTLGCKILFGNLYTEFFCISFQFIFKFDVSFLLNIQQVLSLFRLNCANRRIRNVGEGGWNVGGVVGGEEGRLSLQVCMLDCYCAINKHLMRIITIEITRGWSRADQSVLSRSQHVLTPPSLLFHLPERDW